MADSSRAHLSPLDTNLTINVQEDLELPPVRISTSPPFANTRAPNVNEARKLFSHVLIQLANRSKPPSIIDSITNATNDLAERGLGALAETLREAVKLGNSQGFKPRQNNEPHEDHSEDEGNIAFATDGTIDLLMQLKDVIAMAIAQGWQIFDDSSLWEDGPHDADSKLPSPFRSSRHSSKSTSVHPRSASRHGSKGQVQVPDLLPLCVSVLGSIVAEDCRYRVAFPRPSRPPNALQILTLNIAQFLLHTHQHNPYVISQVTFAMLPAFYTFHSHMYARLLTFMETSVIRIILQNLGRLHKRIVRKRHPEPSHETHSQSNSEQNLPLVSIQIDEVGINITDSTRGWTPYPPFTLSTTALQSANDPHQSPQMYELAFLVPPILGAILETLNTTPVSTIGSDIYSRFGNLLDLLASSKVDLYNDLLEIIAYRGPTSRRLAVASLAKLWPNAIGHTVISQPLCSNDYVTTPESADAHQFMPWYFNPEHRQVRVNEILHDNCRSCSKIIDGFALICPYCMTAVHFDCYDCAEGNYEVQYSMANDPRVQRVAMCRFSYLQADREKIRSEISEGRHIFQVANWFTLCLCFVCRKPLWGCFSQGVKCQRCPIALHLNCRGSMNTHGSSRQCGVIVTSDDMTIDWSELRRSCLEYFPVLKSTRDQLKNSSYEEISTFLGVLRTQLHILINGITFGTLVVLQNGIHVAHDGNHNIQPFELHATVKTCEELIDASVLPFSSMTQQFIEDTNTEMFRPSIVFDWSYLEYVTSAVKSSLPQNGDPHHSAFLSIDNPIDHPVTSDRIAHPYVSAPLSHLRSILGLDFSLRSDQAAKFVLNQLRHLSFVERQDRAAYPFQDFTLEQDVQCVFPLPLGLDLSTNVETLVCSVESSLSDLDLSINEFGFLLLTRRFWPSGLASEYGLKRLAKRIISWILDEDSHLAIILREFVAKQRNLPGVRLPQSTVPWPQSPNTRSAPSSTASNGGDFVSARRSLLTRFALPWLSRLHDLDPVFYCQTLFDTCSQIAEAGELDSNAMFGFAIRGNDQLSRLCDNLLRLIIKLSQNSVIFSVFDALLLRWMHLVFERGVIDKPLPCIHRLFIQENEPLQLSSIVGDPVNPYVSYSPSVDPLATVLDFARESESSIPQALLYFTMLVKSGVNIPTATFAHFFTIIASNKLDGLANANILMKSIILSLWQKSIGRQDLQSLVASLHNHFSPHISQCLVSGENSLVALSIIRQSLAACLLICGCERASVLAAGMVDINEIQDLPSRRKVTVRVSTLEDPIIIQPEILTALQLYLQSSLNDVSCLVAKFLNLFLVESPFLESFEVDNFILRNGKLIALCIWTTYDVQQEDLVVVRTNLFLRSIVVDSEPLQEIVQGCLDPSSNCIQQRLSGLNRLFHIISDVTSPAFNLEGRQWRSSVTCIFHFYFSSLWADPSEEIRMAVRSYSAALLPAHFKVISQCWNASLSTAPIAERTRLVGFLIQLRPHFSGWKVVSWETVIETLMEYDYDSDPLRGNFLQYSSGMNNGGAYRLSTTDPDMAHLRISLILLSFQMVADGVGIDSFSLMKIKVQFIQVAGFSKISVIPIQNGQSFHLQFGDIEELSESAYSCTEELVRIVDAPYYIDLPHSVLGHADSHEDEPLKVLVGSPFLDVSLCMLSTLRDLSLLPILTLKAVLETLYIILHKYDFEDHYFQHLQPLLRRAVVRTTELLSKDISYELRQLALSIAQTSIKKCHGFFGATIGTILDLVSAEVASQVQSSQDSLVVHGKSLIENTLHAFCNHGLLLSLIKRPRPIEFFTVLNQVFSVQGKEISVVSAAICDLLVRDTLARIVDCDLGSFQTALLNLSSFIEYVYFQDYSVDLINFIGQHLVHLVRRMSDGTIAEADSSPLVAISVVVLQHHPVYAKDLLPYIGTVLRVALNRLHVSKSSLTRLVHVSSSQRFKTQEFVSTIDAINVLYDVLLDGFRMKTKIIPSTLVSLIEALLSTDDPDVDPPSETHVHLFQNLLEDAYIFLQSHTWLEDDVDHEFEAVGATARLFLLGCSRDPIVFQKFTEQTSDSKLPRTPLTIRSWNILVLAALQEPREDYRLLIYAHFNRFGNIYSSLLRAYVYSGISSSVTAISDINQAHIAIKLWLMLTHSMVLQAKNGESSISTVWNELWPAYEGFLNVLETEAQVGQHPTIISLASTSVADLLPYLHSLKTSLSLDTSTHVAILNRLRMLNHGDSSSGKITRAVRAISEPQPEVERKILLDQIAKELVAAEKIRMAESKRDSPKVVGDKFKKEGRLLAT